MVINRNSPKLNNYIVKFGDLPSNPTLLIIPNLALDLNLDKPTKTKNW